MVRARVLQAVAFVVFSLGTAAAPLAAAPPNGSIAGRVTNAAGQPVAGAEVQILGLHRRVAAGADGEFLIPDVPPGRYLLEVSSPMYGNSVQQVTVGPGQRAEVRPTLDPRVQGGEIVVTASAEAQSREELARPVNVLGRERIEARLQPSLGETLAQESGISATTYGAGASRPVIRGIGDDRIRILQSGVGVGDASATSPDHAVSLDPIFAERIEVLRGPAALLYGSSAVGGVVNVIDRRIPDYVPSQLDGNLDLRLGSAAEERSAIAALNGGGGPWAWHVDALDRKSGDYRIPRSAEAEHAAEGEEGEAPAPRSGVLANSFVDSRGGAIGLSYIPANGFTGLSVSALDKEYGIPRPGETGVSIDQKQRRLDLLSEWNRGFGPIQSMRLRFGLTDYEHHEREEGGGTTFLNNFWEVRTELIERRRGPLSGSVGIQAQRRSYSAFGEEEFLVPPSVAKDWGVFTFQEINAGNFKWEFGARLEDLEIVASDEDLPDRSFSGLSGSVALTWQLGSAYALALSVSRSIKFPNAEELYSNGGFCIGTQTFNQGDPRLGKEASLGTDLALRRRDGRLRWEIDLFHNRFNRFIFGQVTGEKEGHPVVQFLHRDADFKGGEVIGDLQLLAVDDDRLDLKLSADYVRATLRQTGEPLPRIPPLRYGLGLQYQRRAYGAQIELRRIGRQDRVSEHETPTAGSTQLNASFSRRFLYKATVYDLLLRGTNLTNAEVRNHVSILKDQVPLPGRDVSLSIRFSF